MKNVSEVPTMELSNYINVIRKMLLIDGFFEHHLYSTTNYKIEGTECFKVEDETYLRFNPEPEIWLIGDKYDKFFWIGNLFRKEKKLTPIHKKEFIVVDIYLKEKDRKDMVSLFFKILEYIEKSLNLQNISKLPIENISYSQFKNENLNKHEQYWLVVADYPIEESFYDKENKLKNGTTKFEIYFINEGNAVELAVGGNLGENLNKKRFIRNGDKFVNKKIFSRNFIGFGFGVERLIYVYKNTK